MSDPAVFNRELRNSVNHVDRLLRAYLRGKQAGALVELSYANPVPYTELVKAADSGLTDYFMSRTNFEGPALRDMGNRIFQETQERLSIANQTRIGQKKLEFQSNGAFIGNDIRSMFEIGPGTGKKILEFLQSELGPSIQSVGFIDKQVAFTDEATRGVRRENPSIHVTQISQDIFQEAGRHKFSSKVLGLVLGGTISNVVIDGYPNERTEYPKEQFSDMFRILSNYYSKEEGGALLVSADTSDVQTMLNGYRDRPGTSYNADFGMNSLDLIEKVFEEANKIAPGYEKDKYTIKITSEDPNLQGRNDIKFRDIFRAETKYFSKSQLAAHCQVSDYPCSITIGKTTKIDLEAGWYNATIISAKPRVDQLISAAEKTQRFSFVDSTRNEERVTDQGREYRSVDLLRFAFKSSAELSADSDQPSRTLLRPTPLQLIREALVSGYAASPAYFRPA